MTKFSKVRLGLLVASCMVAFNTTMALAAPSVTETKDNVKVTKQAEWTSFNGSQSDNEGNPYAKISFNIDLTNASDDVVNVPTQAGDADVVIVLDNSGSMGAEFGAAKDAAADFAASLIDIEAYNVRVGLVTMGSTGIRAVEFTSDKTRITSAIRNLEFDPVMWGTNFQEALYETQNMLSTSTAPNKLIVFQSDGVPEQCYKTVNCTNKTGSNIALGSNDSDCALKQTDILKRLYPDVKLATIGYTHATSNHTVLRQMSSRDENGNLMFFEATARSQVTAYLGNLADAFEDTSNTFSNIISGNTLVDEVPSEYEIMENSLNVSDTRIQGRVDDSRNLVTFTWNDRLERKVYNISFIIKLKRAQVPSDYISEQREIYTNGETIDITTDSTDSAIFTYGNNGKIGLKSPTLKVYESLFRVEIPTPEGPTTQATRPENNNNNNDDDDKLQTDESKSDDTPSTGDSFNTNIIYIMLGSGIILASVCGIYIRRKKMVHF